MPLGSGSRSISPPPALPPWIPNGKSQGRHHIKYKDPKHPHYHDYIRPPTNLASDHDPDVALSIQAHEAAVARRGGAISPTTTNNNNNYTDRRGRSVSPNNNQSSRVTSATRNSVENSQSSIDASRLSDLSRLQGTSARRRYNLMSHLSGTKDVNAAAASHFEARMEQAAQSLAQAGVNLREDLYSSVERDVNQAVLQMEADAHRIAEEGRLRIDKEGEEIRRRAEIESRAWLEKEHEKACVEIRQRLEFEGRKPVHRQLAFKSIEDEILQMQASLNERHKKDLEEGALKRLNEREIELANERARIRDEVEEEGRDRMKELSEKLGQDAREQISEYERELHNLRDARCNEVKAKENQGLAAEIAALKQRFMEQASREIDAIRRGSDEEEAKALANVRDEAGRFQALKAAEITSVARGRRAEGLPAVAIELEERAENIERAFRRALREEETREERVMVAEFEADMRRHVIGAREAIVDDNEDHVKETAESFRKFRGQILLSRANYLKVPVSSLSASDGDADESGLVRDTLSSQRNQRDATNSDEKTGGESTAQPVSVRAVTMQFEQLLEKYSILGTRLVDVTLEGVLLKGEIRNGRVRRAEKAKSSLMTDTDGFPLDGGNDQSGGSLSYNRTLLCPTCKPLMEANAELQKVAEKARRREKERQHNSASRQSSKPKQGSASEGGGGSSSGIALPRAFVNAKGMMSKVGGGRASPGAESMDSAGSREADFVKRFLGKVSKNTNSLKGTLSILTGGESSSASYNNRPTMKHNKGFENTPGSNHNFDPVEQRSHASSHKHHGAGPDDPIVQALSASGTRSKSTVAQKMKMDDVLVQRLLGESTTSIGADGESRSKLSASQSRVSRQQHSMDVFGSDDDESELFDIGAGPDASFSDRPAVMAPALDTRRIAMLVETGGRRKVDDSFDGVM